MAKYKVEYEGDTEVYTITFRGIEFSEKWKDRGSSSQDNMCGDICDTFPDMDEYRDELGDLYDKITFGKDVYDCLEELGEYEQCS